MIYYASLVHAEYQPVIYTRKQRSLPCQATSEAPTNKNIMR